MHPHGAALLAHFGHRFGPQPPMTVEHVGVGVGAKEFPAANCVRAFWGQSCDQGTEEVCELVCHIDDMTAEALSYAADALRAKGAPGCGRDAPFDETGPPRRRADGAVPPGAGGGAGPGRAGGDVHPGRAGAPLPAGMCSLPPSARWTPPTAPWPSSGARGTVCARKSPNTGTWPGPPGTGLPFQQVWEDVTKAAGETKEELHHE